jgi:hypothetical protein
MKNVGAVDAAEDPAANVVPHARRLKVALKLGLQARTQVPLVLGLALRGVVGRVAPRDLYGAIWSP